MLGLQSLTLAGHVPGQGFLLFVGVAFWVVIDIFVFFREDVPMSPRQIPPSVVTPASKRWFHEPYAWLVVSGPLVVVVASIVTVVLAVKNPDPVLSTKPVVKVQGGAEFSSQDGTAAQLSIMPAGQARNHVVTPRLPADD